MKKGILLLFTVISFFTCSQLTAQSSCPVFVKSTFQIQEDWLTVCQKTVSFDYINPTGDNYSLNLTIKVNSIVVLNTCIDAAGFMGEQRTFISAEFTACPLSMIEATITPYAGSGCTGESCKPIVQTGGGSTLPVAFTLFNATRTNPTTVLLKWETATEVNNSGFGLERNTNGRWESIAFIPSQSPDGNSNSRLAYQFSDGNNNKGITQYRIRQKDLDGNSKYSEVRAVQGDKQDAKTVVFPTPSTDGNITVLFADAANRDISLLDMTGRTLKQWKAYTNNSLAITSLNPGMYSLRLQNQATGTITTQKIMINAR